MCACVCHVFVRVYNISQVLVKQKCWPSGKNLLVAGFE